MQRSTPPPGAVGLLTQVAMAANSALSPPELLWSIARLTMEALAAEGASVLLADAERGALVPMCTVGHGVEVQSVPLVEAPMARGADVLAPLAVDGRPVGVFVVVGAGADAADVVAAVAALASIALRNARLVERSEAKAATLARLVAVAAELNATSSLAGVVERVRAAYADLLGAAACDVRVRPSNTPASGADRVPGTTRRAVPSVSHPVADGDHRTVELEPSQPSSSTVHFPLRTADGFLGYVVVERGQVAIDDLETGQALADLAAAAIARAQMGDRLRLQLHEAEALARLSEVVAGAGGLTVAVRELNRTLPRDLGIRLRSISLANAELRLAVGGRVPDADELEAIRSWRAVLGKGGKPLAPRPVAGGLLVPVAHRSKVHGALRVSLAGGPTVDVVTEDLLLAIGAGCAELVHKAGLQRSLAESERRLAVAVERDRIAQDLHDSVGQLITAMGMRLAQYVADAPDKVWRARLEELLQMAGRGNREVRQSVYALLFLQARGAALPSSIRELCNKFETTTGLPVRFVLHGTPVPLAAPKEDALFRTAHEALVNVERHARASMVTVHLTYGPEGALLTIRDDGVGLGHRDPFGRSGHFGIRAMQRRLEDTGGELRVRNAAPRGVLVEARIPKKKGAARAAGTSRGR
ncbi:MAG TPA: histidine kinase [Acidimicrobiales bacterium]|nr:histidine kinase [Acidimicrobiales bacterium]